MRLARKFVRENFRISFRRWEPLDQPYVVTQSMLQNAFLKHKKLLKKYLYLGWNKYLFGGSKRKRPVFTIATGETRKEARQNFKEKNEWCWIVRPEKIKKS